MDVVFPERLQASSKNQFFDRRILLRVLMLSNCEQNLILLDYLGYSFLLYLLWKANSRRPTPCFVRFPLSAALQQRVAAQVVR